MVKIPSLEDLKKVGAGLVDSAKSVKFNEVMDKVKSGIETVSGGLKQNPVPQGDEAIKSSFQAIYTALAEVSQLQMTQNAVIKKIENQVALLAKIIEAQKDNPESTPKREDKQEYENDES